MGFFYEIRGWFHTPWPEQFRQVQKLIDHNDRSSGYNRLWVFPPTPAGWNCPEYIFFGGSVRDVSVDDVRSLIRVIAETVRSLDGDITDYVEGYFHADAEDDSVRLAWLCRDGKFHEDRFGKRNTA